MSGNIESITMTAEEWSGFLGKASNIIYNRTQYIGKDQLVTIEVSEFNAWGEVNQVEDDSVMDDGYIPGGKDDELEDLFV